MNLSICTISFRHHLVSIEQLVSWAKINHFHGIELWGVHAKNLADQPQYDSQWLASYGLQATMISDYLPLFGDESECFYRVELLSRLAKHWGAKKIRIFAGDKGSVQILNEERKFLASRLKLISQWLTKHDLTLIIETHPNTFADNLESTQWLIDQVNQENFKINFDVLHVWESKANIFTALEQLRPHIAHFHLKNISSENLLNVFSPANVYSASGSREGMVPVFDGAINFREFIEYIHHHELNLSEIDTSLEWFGNNCKNILKHDRYLIQQLQQQLQQQHQYTSL